MKILRRRVNGLVENELKLANCQNPLFSSKHEGLGVITEEFIEACEDFDALRDVYNDFTYGVCHDDDEMVLGTIHSMDMIAIEAACELIQVAAMARKFESLYEDPANKPFTQEEADWLATMDTMTDHERDTFVCEKPSFLNEDAYIRIPAHVVDGVVESIMRKVDRYE